MPGIVAIMQKEWPDIFEEEIVLKRPEFSMTIDVNPTGDSMINISTLLFSGRIDQRYVDLVLASAAIKNVVVDEVEEITFGYIDDEFDGKIDPKREPIFVQTAHRGEEKIRVAISNKEYVTSLLIEAIMKQWPEVRKEVQYNPVYRKGL